MINVTTLCINGSRPGRGGVGTGFMKTTAGGRNTFILNSALIPHPRTQCVLHSCTVCPHAPCVFMHTVCPHAHSVSSCTVYPHAPCVSSAHAPCALASLHPFGVACEVPLILQGHFTSMVPSQESQSRLSAPLGSSRDGNSLKGVNVLDSEISAFRTSCPV